MNKHTGCARVKEKCKKFPLVYPLPWKKKPKRELHFTPHWSDLKKKKCSHTMCFWAVAYSHFSYPKSRGEKKRLFNAFEICILFYCKISIRNVCTLVKNVFDVSHVFASVRFSVAKMFTNRKEHLSELRCDCSKWFCCCCRRSLRS